MNPSESRLSQARLLLSSWKRFEPHVVFFVLAFILPLSVMHWPTVIAGTPIVLALVVTTYSAAKISYLVHRGEPRVLSIGFQLFVYPFLGLAALAQVSSGQFPQQGSDYSTSTVVQAFVVIIVGLAAYEAGSFLRDKKRSPSSDGSRLSFGQTGIMLVSAIGLLFVALTVARTGFQPFFSSRADAARVLAGTDRGPVYEIANKAGYLLQFQLTRVPIFVGLVGLLIKLREQTWRHTFLGKPGTAALLTLLIGANVIINNPIANSRFWFGVVALTIAAIYLPWRSERGFRNFTYGGLAVFVALFSVLDAFRRARVDLTVRSPRENMVADGTYSAFQSVMNGIVYLQDHSLTAGRQLAGAVFTFVPRSVWKSKPVDTGELVSPINNRAVTLWTELQIDFGPVGVVIGFFLYGFLMRGLEQNIQEVNRTMASILIIAVGVQILLLRGTLVAALGSVYPLALFVALALIGGRPSGDQRPQNPAGTGRGSRYLEWAQRLRGARLLPFRRKAS